MLLDDAHSDKTKQTLRAKCEEYLNRAEELKKFTSGKKKPISEGSGKKEGGGEDGSDDDDEETKRLKNALSGAIVIEKPNVKWDDVAGLKGAKEALQEAVIMPVRFPHLFVGWSHCSVPALRLVPHPNILAFLCRQQVSLERHPPVWPSRDRQELSGESSGDRGQQLHIHFRLQLGLGLQVAGREREVSCPLSQRSLMFYL